MTSPSQKWAAYKNAHVGYIEEQEAVAAEARSDLKFHRGQFALIGVMWGFLAWFALIVPQSLVPRPSAFGVIALVVFFTWCAVKCVRTTVEQVCYVRDAQARLKHATARWNKAAARWHVAYNRIMLGK